MLAALSLLLLSVSPAAEPGYEDRLVTWALEQQQRVIEPNPEGKRIEEILVSAEDVFSASDPWPSLLNFFHIRTRDSIIRREVLQQPGDLWEADRIAETERQMRRLFILAVVRIVPVQGKAGGVALLVVTKDRWSLRLNSDFLVVGNLLQFLRIRPTEENFLGRNQQWTLDFLLKLDTLSISEIIDERRVLGSRIRFAESVGLVLNRATSKPEGSFGSFVIERPLFSLDEHWGFSVVGGWNIRTRRTYCGARICSLVDDASGVAVPRIYDVREFNAEARGTRSFGRLWKSELSAAVGGYGRRYSAPDGNVLSPEQLSVLQSQLLPRSEDATYLLGYYRFYKSEFRVFKNIEVFELSEDFQVGPLFQAGARWAIPTFTKSNFVEVAAAVRYRWLLHDDLLTITVSGAIRLVPGGPSVNRHLAGEISNFSPEFEGGRFYARVLFDLIQNDLDNRVILLGAGEGLRGAPAQFLTGKNLVLANFEYRTRSFELKTIFVGFVLFYDAGSAFNTRPNLTHTVGIGMRIMLPQFNQEIIRLDVGFVLGGDQQPGIDRLSVGFGQVSSLRPTFLDDPL